jgi:hypothetical protein
VKRAGRFLSAPFLVCFDCKSARHRLRRIEMGCDSAGIAIIAKIAKIAGISGARFARIFRILKAECTALLENGR